MLIHVDCMCEISFVICNFIDINECAVNNGQCDHNCHNTEGSYYCTCKEGYVLLTDQRGCSGENVRTMYINTDLLGEEC